MPKTIFNRLDDLVADLINSDSDKPNYFSTALGGYLSYQKIEKCYLDQFNLPNFRITIYDEEGKYLRQYLRNKRSIGATIARIPSSYVRNQFTKLASRPKIQEPNDLIAPDLHFKNLSSNYRNKSNHLAI
jgi:hypothetical protein